MAWRQLRRCSSSSRNVSILEEHVWQCGAVKSNHVCVMSAARTFAMSEGKKTDMEKIKLTLYLLRVCISQTISLSPFLSLFHPPPLDILDIADLCLRYLMRCISQSHLTVFAWVVGPPICTRILSVTVYPGEPMWATAVLSILCVYLIQPDSEPTGRQRSNYFTEVVDQAV